MKKIQTVIAILLLVGACSPKVDTGGYVREGSLKDMLVVGQTTKDEVLSRFGSPSSQSSFGDETWYYITDRKEAVAFMKPEVVEQDVIQIQFDSTGVVSEVQTYNKDNAKELAMASRKTPTEGHTLGFFEQLLGNIGRFNRPNNDSAAPGRKPGGGF